jgi:hypothetical protein
VAAWHTNPDPVIDLVVWWFALGPVIARHFKPDELSNCRGRIIESSGRRDGPEPASFPPELPRTRRAE